MESQRHRPQRPMRQLDIAWKFFGLVAATLAAEAIET